MRVVTGEEPRCEMMRVVGCLLSHVSHVGRSGPAQSSAGQEREREHGRSRQAVTHQTRFLSVSLGIAGHSHFAGSFFFLGSNQSPLAPPGKRTGGVFSCSLILLFLWREGRRRRRGRFFSLK